MAQSRWSSNPADRVQGMGTGAYYTPGYGYSVGGPFGGWTNYSPMGVSGGGIGQLPNGQFYGGSHNSLAGMIAAGLQGGNILNHTQFMTYTPGFTTGQALGSGGSGGTSGGQPAYAASQEEQEQIATGHQNQTGSPNPPNPMNPAAPWPEEEEFGYEDEVIDEYGGDSGYSGISYGLPDILGVKGVPGAAWLEEPRPTMSAAAPGSVAEGYKGGDTKGYGYPNQQKTGGYGALKGAQATPNPQVFDAETRRQSIMNLRQRAY